MARPAAGWPFVAGSRRIALRAEFDAGDVVEADEGAVGRTLQDDVAELLRGLETALRGDGGVELLAGDGGKSTELSGRDLRVLPRDGVRDVARHQGVFHQLVRVEPDAHGVVRPEQTCLADTGHPLQRVVQRAVDVVAEVVGAQPVVGGDESDDHQKAGRCLVDRDAVRLNHLRQLGGDELQFVLHLHLSDVGVGAALEGEGDRCLSGRGRSGRHVVEVVDAGHALFDDLGHRILHRLGIGAGVGGGDADGRRSDLRIL